METQLKDAMLEVIEKNLPQATAENLKILLTERDAAIKKVKVLEAKVKARDEVIEDLNTQIAKLNNLNLESRDLKSERDALEESKRNLRVNIAEYKLAEAEKRANVVTQLADTVFKNRNLVQTSFTSGSIPVKDNSGYVSNFPLAMTTTVTNNEE